MVLTHYTTKVHLRIPKNCHINQLSYYPIGTEIKTLLRHLGEVMPIRGKKVSWRIYHTPKVRCFRKKFIPCENEWDSLESWVEERQKWAEREEVLSLLRCRGVLSGIIPFSLTTTGCCIRDVKVEHLHTLVHSTIWLWTRLWPKSIHVFRFTKTATF